MRGLILLFLATILTSCQAETPPAASPVEALCTDSHDTIDYADFYWDHLRTTDPDLFRRALSICSRQCPGSEPCAPVLSVARWYEPVSPASSNSTESNREERPQ